MCDYSLHDVAFRPARIGDKLVSTRFAETITRGFAAESDLDVAVCLLPGTELAFEADVCVGARYWGVPAEVVAARVARFTQVNLDEPLTHHDALEIPNGKIVTLTSLCEGQRATVLQLPSTGAKVQPVATPERAGALIAADF